MTTIRSLFYDSDGNLVNEEVIDVPDDSDDAADREFREAIEKATTIADLKAALLGTRGPGAEPRRPIR